LIVPDLKQNVHSIELLKLSSIGCFLNFSSFLKDLASTADPDLVMLKEVLVVCSPLYNHHSDGYS
jgi:hypothetical protein